jgi:hypothetical protein
LQLRFARDQIDRRGKRAIRAVIRDLGREINRHTERDAQNIQEREERMTAQMAENVPNKNPRVLRGHVPFTTNQIPRTTSGRYQIPDARCAFKPPSNLAETQTNQGRASKAHG